jgi:hypothetical protein
MPPPPLLLVLPFLLLAHLTSRPGASLQMSVAVPKSLWEPAAGCRAVRRQKHINNVTALKASKQALHTSKQRNLTPARKAVPASEAVYTQKHVRGKVT